MFNMKVWHFVPQHNYRLITTRMFVMYLSISHLTEYVGSWTSVRKCCKSPHSRQLSLTKCTIGNAYKTCSAYLWQISNDKCHLADFVHTIHCSLGVERECDLESTSTGCIILQAANENLVNFMQSVMIQTKNGFYMTVLVFRNFTIIIDNWLLKAKLAPFVSNILNFVRFCIGSIHKVNFQT